MLLKRPVLRISGQETAEGWIAARCAGSRLPHRIPAVRLLFIFLISSRTSRQCAPSPVGRPTRKAGTWYPDSAYRDRGRW